MFISTGSNLVHRRFCSALQGPLCVMMGDIGPRFVREHFPI